MEAFWRGRLQDISRRRYQDGPPTPWSWLFQARFRGVLTSSPPTASGLMHARWAPGYGLSGLAPEHASNDPSRTCLHLAQGKPANVLERCVLDTSWGRLDQLTAVYVRTCFQLSYSNRIGSLLYIAGQPSIQCEFLRACELDGSAVRMGIRGCRWTGEKSPIESSPDTVGSMAERDLCYPLLAR